MNRGNTLDQITHDGELSAQHARFPIDKSIDDLFGGLFRRIGEHPLGRFDVHLFFRHSCGHAGVASNGGADAGGVNHCYADMAAIAFELEADGFGEAAHGELASGIGAWPGVPTSPKILEMLTICASGSAFEHGQEGFRHADDRPEVDLKEPFEFVERDLFETCRPKRDAGAIDKNGDAAMLGFDRLREKRRWPQDRQYRRHVRSR